MSEEDDLAWLKTIQDDLWEVKSTFVSSGRLCNRYDDKKRLTYDQVDRIGTVIEAHNLVTEMFCSGMFGGVGMAVYSHPIYIGTGADLILNVCEYHLPGPRPPSWHERLIDEDGANVKTYPPRIAGGVNPYAWELFRSYTTRPDNVRWLKEYGLEPNKSMGAYEY